MASQWRWQARSNPHEWQRSSLSRQLLDWTKDQCKAQDEVSVKYLKEMDKNKNCDELEVSFVATGSGGLPAL